ncbi:hypothetical protein GCM10022244_59900 [Streptomyces gulbargensis]|uniref:Integral membrane protein n=1 Tax=Streptomyces gulbargensis TaxID=364901 RepID=A0ABP7NE83_9ACTN
MTTPPPDAPTGAVASRPGAGKASEPGPGGAGATRAAAGPGASDPSTAPARRPLATELRRGLGPWTGAAVALTVLVAMYGKAPAWQGRWSDATDLLHLAAGLLGGPLALAAGCRQGGRDRRRGTAELWESVPRSPLRRLLVAVAPSALWPAAGVLLADAVGLLATRPYVSGGRPDLGLLLADAVAVGSLGALGHVAGRLVPWRLTAPVLGIAGYVGLAAGTYTLSAARWLSPAADSSTAWMRPVWWFAPVSMAWTAGLACAALLACGARTARSRALALVPLAVAVAAAVPVLRLPPDDGPWRRDPAATRAVCDSGEPRVCVTVLDGRLLPEVSAALAPVNERLRGLPGAPVRWAVGPVEPRPGDVEIADAAGTAVRGRLIRPDVFRHAAVAQLLARSCDEEAFRRPGQERAALVHLAVHEWLAPAPPGHGTDPSGAQEYLDRLRAKAPAAQRAYLARYLAADHCRPEEVPAP